MDFYFQFEIGIRDFVATHHDWAGPITFALAFGESLAFIGFLLPATAAMVMVGVLIGKGMLDWWFILLWAIPGAALGDWVSYWIGRKFDRVIGRVWPFRSHPEMLEQGHAFFERWGIASVFLGRFFGPVRAVIPLVAGMMDMPRGRFQIANWSSAVLWAFYWLGVGVFGDRFFTWLFERFDAWTVTIICAAAVVIAVLFWRWHRSRNS